VRELEHAGPAIVGSGERSLFVPEDLALEERLGNRRAVDRDKRKRRPRTQLVNGPRDELLAGPRFSPDQHRRVGRRRLLDDAIDGADVGAVADDPPEAALVAQLPAQILHFAQRPLTLDRLLQEDAQTRRIDRLAQIVVCAFFNGLDRGLHRALRREQDEREIGQLVLQCTEELEPAHPRHDKVGDDDRRAKRGDLFHRLLAVRGLIGVEPPGSHQFGQPDARCRVVLDDEDTLGNRASRGLDRTFNISRHRHNLASLTL